MTIKGYPDQQKIDAGANHFATVAPIREQQFGLDVAAHVYFQLIGSDAAEAASTTRIIVASAHAALVGDVISWTSGALDTKEFRVVAVSTDAITTAEAMSVAPTAADTFDILRQKAPVVGSSGGISVSEGGFSRAIAPVSYDHTVAVTTAAYTQIIAATAAGVTRLYVGDTSGRFLKLAVGAAASEVDQMILTPGFAGWISLIIAANSRVSIKAVDANTAAGLFVISGFS